MPELRNQRWETFARAVAMGVNAKGAYMGAGYTAQGNSAETNAARLLRNAVVLARVQELKAEINAAATAKMHLDTAWVVDRLMAIADGRVHDDSEPGAVSMPARIQALGKLGEHLGIWKAPAEADFETAARALAKQLGIEIAEARDRIREAERYAREHA